MILKNPLATYHKTPAEKLSDFNNAATSGAYAVNSDGQRILLSSLQCDKVEFIGGLWRVQNETNHQIKQIRDQPLILGERLPHHERTLFEFYSAMKPCFNCYGLLDFGFNLVVAKYTTISGTFWGYGNTIEQARAFLGIKLYDEHQELINSFLNQKIPQQR